MRFATDKSNQLVLRRKKEKILVKGSFSVDSKNRLNYLVNQDNGWRRKHGIGRKIVFEGAWRLTPEHDLILFTSRGDELALRGEIISVSANALVFSVESGNQQRALRLLQLKGVWQANSANQIVFQVEKRFSPDALVFSAGWQVNQNQQVVYTYKKQAQSLIFQGFWRIDSRNQLAYVLSTSCDSRFDFKVSLESPSIYAQTGEIKYRIGIGFGRLKKEKVFSLYGAWKFSRNLALNFEMEYAKGCWRKMEFGSQVDLTSKDKVILNLVNKNGNQLGISLTYSRKFLENNQAEAFLRLKRLQKESGLDFGIRIPF